MVKNWFPLITNNMFVDNDSKETVTKHVTKSYAHYSALVTRLNVPFSTNMHKLRIAYGFPITGTCYMVCSAMN